ncbi:alpha/beta hydrolase [Actinomycetospora termitidis]|uniref:Alpha/beta hydrolase n=1 Tax=Actinomycetospora termitidis TaxID=3053470 RepID=A0ABT7M7S7_9PSEU|nr:alpha/beta hydrolase [Actinomycetospora sp. Odt1-22]MDL5156726.1 alpha/beta hydrolase [Actinomycetospora sp. Odt1-22]
MTPTRAPRRRLAGALLAGVALVVLGLAALAVVLIALGALVPGLGPLSGYATITVPGYGPTLVVVGLVVVLLALVVRLRLRRAGTVVAVLGGVGTVALGVVVGLVVSAAGQAGGSVDLVRAVDPHGGGSVPDGYPQYGTGPDGAPLHAAVYRPGGARGPVPVFVYVHGGGWVGGSELDNSADMRWFADQGRLVVSVGYTLATRDRPTWDLAGAQVACALAQVAALAPGQGGDPSRLVLSGDSAGGQLAVSVAYHAASGTQASACGGRVPVPRGVLVQYPAVDPAGAWEEGRVPGDPGNAARGFQEAYTGGTPEQVPDRYTAVAGVPAITPAAPPTLVLAPTDDELVPPDGVAAFVDAARATGVDATLVRIPYANHAYDIGGVSSLGNQVRRSVSQAWLGARGW